MFLVRVPGGAGAELYKPAAVPSRYLPALISVPQPAYSGCGADEIRASPTNAASRRCRGWGAANRRVPYCGSW
jgi:hypothetical protein